MGLAKRKLYPEQRAFARCALCGDISSMPLCNLAADRQPNTSTLIGIPALQALKHRKNPVQVFLIEPNAVVFNHESEYAIDAGFSGRRFLIYKYRRRSSFLVKF